MVELRAVARPGLSIARQPHASARTQIVIVKTEQPSCPYAHEQRREAFRPVIGPDHVLIVSEGYDQLTESAAGTTRHGPD